MPKCKNNPKKSYMGTEPSPKGLGYCAHAENLKTIKKGKDGNMWIVQKTKSGVKRWVRHKTKEDKIIEEYKKMLKMKYIDYGKDMKKFNKLLEKLDDMKYDWYPEVIKRILDTKKKSEKSFIVTSGKVIVSDPSYDFPKNKKATGGLLGQEIFKVPTGKWKGYYFSWITKERPNILVVTHTKYDFPSNKLKYDPERKTFAVDGGVVTIRDVEKYIDYDSENMSWKEWDKDMIGLGNDKEATAVDGGYVCHTGWGDGFYGYTVGYDKKTKLACQFIVYFIP